MPPDTPAVTPADLAAAEKLVRETIDWRPESYRVVHALTDAVTAALGNARREGREAGLKQAAERVRWLASIHRGVGGELHLKCEAILLALAHDITALPPPGEEGK
jgi:hypothetical protein